MLQLALEHITHARESAAASDYASAAVYYQTGLQQLNKSIKGLQEPHLLGKARDTSKRVAEELEAVQEIIQHLDAIRGGPAGPGPGSLGQRLEFDVPRNHASYDDGYRQAPYVSHTSDTHDPDVWRPPTRDGFNAAGPVRIGQARAVAPLKARISSDDNKLPNWSRNTAGGQAAVIPVANGAGRAPSAQRLQQGGAGPVRINAAAPGNARGGGGSAPGAGAGYEKPWRANMAGAKGQGGGVAARQGGGAGGEPGARQEERRINYVGPDADLAPALEAEMLDRSPGVKWEDIAGLANVKSVLKEATVLPLFFPEFFTGIRRPVKGVMLFGPPGTGKTMLAKALATETNCAFFKVSSATLGSKYRGESERMVRCLFDLARAAGPSIVFIDEVDSLCSQRGAEGEHEASRRVKTELLTQIDGLSNAPPAADGKIEARRVMVLAATNFPWDIDEAMRRRLEKRIYIPLPGPTERLDLLRLSLKSLVLGDNINLEEFANRLDGYSCDDITNICRDAAMSGMRRLTEGMTTEQLLKAREAGVDYSREPVLKEDLEDALSRISPSVRAEDVKRHEEWFKLYGSS